MRLKRKKFHEMGCMERIYANYEHYCNVLDEKCFPGIPKSYPLQSKVNIKLIDSFEGHM